MKLLDIMKKYDRCLVRESAKLTKIYNMILKESESTEDPIDEEVCPDCGNDPCTCESDGTEEVVSAEEVFAEKEDKECDECGLIPEEDFIKDEAEEVEENDMLRNRPHNAHINDPKGVLPESEKDEECKEGKCDEAEEMMSAAEFFAEGDKDEEVVDEAKDKEEAEATDESEKPEEKTNEAEEMMSAAEFFSEKDECKGDECKEEVAESEEKKEDDKEVVDESEKDEKKDEDAEKLDESEDDEKKLEESLKSYRRKNHRLFNG